MNLELKSSRRTFLKGTAAVAGAALAGGAYEIVHPEGAVAEEAPIEVKNISMHLSANRAVGVPYTDEMLANAEADMKAQADPNADTSGIEARYPKAKLGDFDGDPTKLTEMDALVAYLQMLGTLVDFSTYDDAAGYR